MPASLPASRPASFPSSFTGQGRAFHGLLQLLHIGNSYTQLWEINNQAIGAGQEISKLVNAIALAMGYPLTGSSYFQSGASFSFNYGTQACLDAIASSSWTHGVLQDLSTGPTGAGLAACIQYGNLLAEEFWANSNPNCSIILRETPAYQVGHSAYPATFDDPDDMLAQVQSGYEACRDNINTLHPDRPPTTIVKCGTLISALGGNLPLDNPSFRHFHDEINDDHTHVNPERAWLEAIMIFVHITRRNPVAKIAAAVSAVVALDSDFTLTHETAEQLATWGYRYVRYGYYPCLFATHPSDLSAEPNADAVFTVDVRGSGTVTLQWYRDGVLLEGETTDTLTLPGVQLGDTGTEVYCTATNSEGTTTSATATLTVEVASMVPVYINFARIVTATPDPASDGYYWNDWNEDGDTTLPNVGVVKSLVDRENTASALTIEVTANVSGFGFEQSNTTNLLGLPDTVVQTMWCTQNGGAGNFTVRVNNLNPGTTYRFHLAAFRNAGSTRTTRITVTGTTVATLDYDAGLNLVSIPYVDMVAPLSGQITFLCDDHTPTSNPIGYLGLMQISNPP